MSLAATLAAVGMRRRHAGVATVDRRGCDARRRASSGSTRPAGVAIQASPSTRRAARAHPAVLTHDATGPCWPLVVLGSTKIAPLFGSAMAPFDLWIAGTRLAGRRVASVRCTHGSRPGRRRTPRIPPRCPAGTGAPTDPRVSGRTASRAGVMAYSADDRAGCRPRRAGSSSGAGCGACHRDGGSAADRRPRVAVATCPPGQSRSRLRTMARPLRSLRRSRGTVVGRGWWEPRPLLRPTGPDGGWWPSLPPTTGSPLVGVTGTSRPRWRGRSSGAATSGGFARESAWTRMRPSRPMRVDRDSRPPLATDGSLGVKCSGSSATPNRSTRPNATRPISSLVASDAFRRPSADAHQHAGRGAAPGDRPVRFRPLAPDPRYEHESWWSRRRGTPGVQSSPTRSRSGLRPAVYGTGWHDLIDPSMVVADYVPNAELPIVYSSARRRVERPLAVDARVGLRVEPTVRRDGLRHPRHLRRRTRRRGAVRRRRGRVPRPAGRLRALVEERLARPRSGEARRGTGERGGPGAPHLRPPGRRARPAHGATRTGRGPSMRASARPVGTGVGHYSRRLCRNSDPFAALCSPCSGRSPPGVGMRGWQQERRPRRTRAHRTASRSGPRTG